MCEVITKVNCPHCPSAKVVKNGKKKMVLKKILFVELVTNNWFNTTKYFLQHNHIVYFDIFLYFCKNYIAVF
jgi:hypothetical protein